MATTRRRPTIFGIITVLLFATISGVIITFGSASAQNSTERQSDNISGTTAINNITGNGSSTASEIHVSIVEGASTMDEHAFDPNPVNVKVGYNITWTNDDSQPHTVTSGTGPEDPNVGKEFDSSPGFNVLLSPFQTFTHKFNTAGEFPYFCQVHPTMVGKIVVS
jgi:plastocyanin